jgi:hypothetical protein
MAKRKTTAASLAKISGQDGKPSADLPAGYANLLTDLKARVGAAQLRAAISVSGARRRSVAESKNRRSQNAGKRRVSANSGREAERSGKNRPGERFPAGAGIEQSERFEMAEPRVKPEPMCEM